MVFYNLFITLEFLRLPEVAHWIWRPVYNGHQNDKQFSLCLVLCWGNSSNVQFIQVDVAVKGRLEDKDWGVRRAAIDTMASRAKEVGAPVGQLEDVFTAVSSQLPMFFVILCSYYLQIKN